MDVLSDVLRAVRMSGALYFDVHAGAPWVAETPRAGSIGAYVMPQSEHVIAFHILLDGSAWAQLADLSQPAICLQAGDAVMFTRGDDHFLGSERGKRSAANPELYRLTREQELPFVLKEFGGDGTKTRFVCGYLGCDARPYNPILAALPRVLHVTGSHADGHLTFDLIRIAVDEGQRARAGGEAMLAKLSELMFLHAICQYIENLPPGSTGWLAGLRDKHVNAALRLMHARPAEPWTLDSLARAVGLSRTVFSTRFSTVMGTPAMQYLSNWRLQLAARLLERPDISLAQVAADIGFGSEAAFNRAFKRQVGVPPGAWRERQNGDFALT